MSHDPDDHPTPESPRSGPQEAPGGSAGSAGTPPGAQGPHPILPGLEKYAPAGRNEFNNSTKSLTPEALAILDQAEAERAVSRGAVINIYPSGEITGGFYRRGGRRTVPVKREKVVSQEFTRQARKTIRRAVESGATTFKIFVSLTFDPKIATLDESGVVDQQWAKKEMKRFLNTVKKQYDRKAEKLGGAHKELSYIWVAEIQELNTNNIHFHILMDQPFIPVKWLVEVWGQAANSVNVKKISNQEHAAKYMLKYMSKGHCPIEGKRYGMTQNLLDAIRPRQIRYDGDDRREAFGKVKRKFYWDIQNHGKITDFGFAIPAPRRAKHYRDRQGNMRKTRAIPRELAERFLTALEKPMKRIDFEHEVDAAFTDRPTDDVPF